MLNFINERGLILVKGLFIWKRLRIYKLTMRLTLEHYNLGSELGNLNNTVWINNKNLRPKI